MPTVANRTRVSTSQLLRQVAQLSWDEFNDLMIRAAALHTPPAGARLSREETNLLLKINEGPPCEWQNACKKALQKRRAASLSAAEERQLLRLADKMERYDAQRLEWLTRLAALRKMPLRVLMRSLGIKTPEYV